MSTLAERMAECMQRHPHLSQADIARACKVETPSVSDWVTGKTKTLKAKTAMAASSLFGCDQNWLSDGIGSPNWAASTATPLLSTIAGEALTRIGPESVRKVPLLGGVPAGDWRSAMALHAVDADDWISCPERCSELAYALRVSGESMEPEYLHGDIVFVDPCADAVHGSDVIVRQNDSDHTLKRLVIEGRSKMLKALNANWPGPRFIELAPDAELAGVVIGMYRGKRKV